MKRITMQDIATSLGISKNAVSLALSGKPGVSEQLRQQIVDHAIKVGYINATRDSGKRLLALLPTHLSNTQPGIATFFQQICFYMEAYAKAMHNYLVFTSVSRDELNTLTLPPIMTSIDFDAIFPISVFPLEYCQMLHKLGLPMVLVDNYFDDVPFNSVTTANASAAYQITMHLINLGHKHIEFIGKRYMTPSIFDRWEGYCRAMNRMGLPIHSNTYLNDHYGDIIDEKGIADAIADLNEMPTAIVCSHDSEARAVCNILRMRGLGIPDDVSVTGFDDIQSRDVTMLNLTTYRTDTQNIAQTAINMFSHTPPSPRRILIHGNMVIRSSTAEPRKDQ